VEGRPRGRELWWVRNDSPFGHRVWASPPSAEEVRRLIEGVIEEVRRRPPDGPVAFQPDDAIVGALKGLEEGVEHVAAGIGLR